MVRLCALFLLIIYFPSLVAGFYFHYGFNIDSFSDTKAKLSFNTMKNNFFIGTLNPFGSFW